MSTDLTPEQRKAVRRVRQALKLVPEPERRVIGGAEGTVASGDGSYTRGHRATQRERSMRCRSPSTSGSVMSRKTTSK